MVKAFRLIYLFTALFLMQRLHAQTTDTSIYYVNYTGTGLVNKTNTSAAYVINNNIKFNVIRKHVSLNTTNAWIYGAQKAGVTNNDVSSIVDMNLFRTTKGIYYWGIAAYDKSYSLRIENRFQGGAGVGYAVVDEKNVRLILSDGPLYEYADLYENTPYKTVRNSFRIKYRVTLRNVIIIEGTNFLQNAFDNPEDYIIKLNNTLSFRLNTWLRLTAATTYNKLNQNRTENLLLNFGLTAERYF